MQGLEVAGIYALIGIAVILLRQRIPDLDKAPLGVRLAAGFAVGTVVAAPILMRGTNLIPDRLEPIVLAVVVSALGVLVLRLRT